MPAGDTTTYRVKAESVEACNCQHGCNCQFAGVPNEGRCEFIIGYEVKDGTFGLVSLDGVRAVVAAKYPKAIHEGNGHVVLFIDESSIPRAGSSGTRRLSRRRRPCAPSTATSIWSGRGAMRRQPRSTGRTGQGPKP
jgi:hypothetical protein